MKKENYEKAKSILEEIENLKRIKDGINLLNFRNCFLSDELHKPIFISGNIAYTELIKCMVDFRNGLTKGIEDLEVEFEKL